MARVTGMPTRHEVVGFVAGAIFGCGLLVSGMIDTRKVQGWLDFFGDWDPTLAFVLGGAVLPMIFVWRVAERRKTSIFGDPIPARSAPVFDRPFIIGSLMFGAGWGLAGLCPGPALASFAIGGWGGALFFLAMVAGMVVTPALRSLMQRANRPV